LSVWCGAENCVSGLRAAALLAIKAAAICNKKHLLHLGGILFPHINNDACSKSLQLPTMYVRVRYGNESQHRLP
jgi:hypothetical protein